MKKLVFLDVDGVLNSDQWRSKTMGRSGDFDPHAIELLNQLRKIGAEVVISSSWGENADNPLNAAGLELPIIGHVDHFYQDWMCRGNEIEKWLIERYGGMGTKYGKDHLGIPYYRKYGTDEMDYEFVILDDDTDFLLGQADNFIHVNAKTGLTQADIDKAIKILNREEL